MSSTKTPFTTPPGRLVAGSLYKEKTTDMSGRPLTVKSGPNVGQPRKEWFFALAIPKGPEAAHGGFGWMVTPWGAIIRQIGEAFMPNAGQMPTFAWKIKDGDSQVPNQAGRKPCDSEGWPGHWVLMFSSGFAPKLYTLLGVSAPTPLEGVDAVNLGDYVQVAGTVDDNDDRTKPGVFLNHGMVCLVGHGQRIVVGPDVASAGFGGAPLPAGASTVPVAAFTPPVIAAPPAVPGSAPALPAVPVAVALPSLPPGLPAVAAVPGTVPNPAFLAPPVPVRRLTAAANGASYEQLVAAGWTDATLIQNGLMLAA